MNCTFAFTIPGKRQRKKRKGQIIFVQEELWHEPSVVSDFWQTLLECTYCIFTKFEKAAHTKASDKYRSASQKSASKILLTKYDSSLPVPLETGCASVSKTIIKSMCLSTAFIISQDKIYIYLEWNQPCPIENRIQISMEKK